MPPAKSAIVGQLRVFREFVGKRRKRRGEVLEVNQDQDKENGPQDSEIGYRPAIREPLLLQFTPTSSGLTTALPATSVSNVERVRALHSEATILASDSLTEATPTIFELPSVTYTFTAVPLA